MCGPIQRSRTQRRLTPLAHYRVHKDVNERKAITTLRIVRVAIAASILGIAASVAGQEQQSPYPLLIDHPCAEHVHSVTRERMKNRFVRCIARHAGIEFPSMHRLTVRKRHSLWGVEKIVISERLEALIPGCGTTHGIGSLTHRRWCSRG